MVFRFELGGATGWGHLARCAALAHELRRHGWNTVAWTDGDLRVAPDDLREPFPAVRDVQSGPGTADWIVVDWYGMSDEELRGLRSSAERAHVLVIDDEATRTLAAADVVVNPRLGLERAGYATGTCLLGERYALLRAGLRMPAPVAIPFPAEVTPVLVVPGGTDPQGIAVEALHALADVDASHLVPVLVRSRTLPGSDAVERALARFAHPVWLERLSAAELAGWAAACRFAISACGGTLYELALVGLPFIGVVVADNQRAFAREVEERWQMPVVDAREIKRSELVAAVQSMLARPPGARVPIGGIDGMGTSRIADVMDGWSH